MESEASPLDQFRNAYIEHRHDSGYEPSLDDLDEADRESAELFLRMMKACEGVKTNFSPLHGAMLLQIHEHNLGDGVGKMTNEPSSFNTGAAD